VLVNRPFRLIEPDPFGFLNHKQAANFQTNHQEGQNLEPPIFDQEHKTTETPTNIPPDNREPTKHTKQPANLQNEKKHKTS